MKPRLSVNRIARRAQRAFTLVEVMMAMAIVGTLFVSLYAGIASGFGIISMTQQDLRATQILTDRMEEFRLYSWSQVNNASYIPANFYEPFFPTGNYTNSDISTTAMTNGGFIYYGTISVAGSGLTESYSNNLRLVTVTLNWTNGVKARTRTASTFVSQYGMQTYIY